MKRTLFTISIILSISAFGQEEIEAVDSNNFENSYASKVISADNISDAEVFAKEDIKNNSLFLIVPGGIAPVIYKSDFDFKSKYGVSMINFGCEPLNKEISISYNMKVLDFLTENYGKEWLKEIRDDVIGLAEYKMKIE
ncbi:hypothetical protein LS48_04585 [Aequorivita aquimaris]|uniref:Uncharacterized protein n=1 Tax=Aequorivita aquimaris TaxID=1548749 RepID=A0A137RKG1_9FLAO|nr:hypothetical protein [Aequorivita aquimaris]KXO00669.1 hypothetical protein LS48_04585 [Aequorivita aquimaris]